MSLPGIFCPGLMWCLMCQYSTLKCMIVYLFCLSIYYEKQITKQWQNYSLFSYSADYSGMIMTKVCWAHALLDYFSALLYMFAPWQCPACSLPLLTSQQKQLEGSIEMLHVHSSCNMQINIQRMIHRWLDRSDSCYPSISHNSDVIMYVLYSDKMNVNKSGWRWGPT